MYVLITSKPGEYDAIPGDGVTPVKRFDYFFYDKRRASYVIAEVKSPSARVDIRELGEQGTCNSVPIKFFESFESVEDAENELAGLAQVGDKHVSLVEAQP